MIIGYDREDWKKFQIKNPVEIVLPKKTNNILPELFTEQYLN